MWRLLAQVSHQQHLKNIYPPLEVTKCCLVRANRTTCRQLVVNNFHGLLLTRCRTLRVVPSCNTNMLSIDVPHKLAHRTFGAHSITYNHDDDTSTRSSPSIGNRNDNSDAWFKERYQIEDIKLKKPSQRFASNRSDQEWTQLHLEIMKKDKLQLTDILDAEQCMRWWISQCRAGVQSTKHQRTRNNRYRRRQHRDDPSILAAGKKHSNDAAKAVVSALDLFNRVVSAIKAQPDLLLRVVPTNDGTGTTLDFFGHDFSAVKTQPEFLLHFYPNNVGTGRATMDEHMKHWYDGHIPRVTHVLNAILDAWRLCWIDLDSDNKYLPTPESVFSMLKNKWSSFVPMNERTYSVVMDAPVATMNLLCDETPKQDVPIFCEKVLSYMLQRKVPNDVPEHLRRFSIGLSTLPDNVAYGTVLNAWARSGHPDAAMKAELQFNQFVTLCSNGTLETLPNTVCYNTLLVAMVSPTKEFIEQRPILLKCANDINQTLDQAIVKNVLRRENALLKAEAKFREMKLCPYPNVTPGTVSFRTIIYSWAEYSVDLRYVDRVKSSIAMDHAVALLYEMAGLCVDSGNLDIDIDYVFFGKIISTLALNQPQILDDGTKADFLRAEEVYHYMLNLYRRTRDERFTPDMSLLSAMTLVFAKSGRPLEAEAILTRLENEARSTNQLSFLPRMSYYLDTLKACMSLATEELKCGKIQSALVVADKAESLILRTIDIAIDTKIEKSIPDQIIIVNMMELWISCRMPQRAENYFLRIESLYERTQCQHLRWRPTHLRRLLCAWASKGNDSSIFCAQQAENVLRELKRRYEISRDVGFRPKVKNISLVMAAWSRTSYSDLIRKCKSLFKVALTEYKAGNVQARPDVALYGCMFKAFSRVGDGQGAMDFLETMKNDYFNNSNHSAKPSIGIFNMILLSWLKSTDVNAPTRALKVFEMIQSRDVKEVLGVRADNKTYSILCEILADTKGQGLEEKYKIFVEIRDNGGKEIDMLQTDQSIR